MFPLGVHLVRVAGSGPSTRSGGDSTRAVLVWIVAVVVRVIAVVIQGVARVVPDGSNKYVTQYSSCGN